MNVMNAAQNFWNRNIRPANDFSSEEPPNPEPEPGGNFAGMAKKAGIGGGIGAVAGGAFMYDNIRRDEPWFDYVTESIPRAEFGSAPQDVFGADLQRFADLARESSDSKASAQSSLQYLAYLQEQAPKTSAEELTNVYGALENQFADDEQVRRSLNLVSAHVTKHGSTPAQAYFELTRHFELEPDFERGAQTFQESAKLADWEINETSTQLVKRHTTRFGHLGMAKGVAIGVGAGLVAGVATGALLHLALSD